MASSSIFSALHYYLVSNPTISTFTWSPPHTPLSSPSSLLLALLLALLLYLSLSFLLNNVTNPNHLIPSSTLSLVSSLHNSVLLLISLLMSVSTALSSLHSFPSPSHFICFPKHTTSPSGPVFFWAYVFYLSKFYELLDTFLILLNPRKSLTFLHVYHHTMVLVMCYAWLQTSQSLMPVGLITNATVHVVMYGYYLCSSLGWRWPVRWKRAVTEIQIWQFVSGFGFSLAFLWMHLFGGGCEGMKGWAFNAVFNASLLGLFMNFRKKAYESKEEKRD